MIITTVVSKSKWKPPAQPPKGASGVGGYGRAERALGNQCRVVSASAPNMSRSEYFRVQDSKRFQLLRDIQKADLDLKHAINFCYKAVSPHLKKMTIAKKNGVTMSSGLSKCRSPFACPVCSSRYAKRRREQIDLAVKEALSKEQSVNFLTFTFPHSKMDALSNSMEDFALALRKFRSHRVYRRIKTKYKISGVIRALEVLYSEKNGWHLHSHELLFSSIILSDSDISELKKLWAESLLRSGLLKNKRKYASVIKHGLDVRQDELKNSYGYYLTKSYGYGVSQEHSKLSFEMTSSETKNSSGTTPLALFSAGRHDLFKEYVLSMKNRKPIVATPGLLKDIPFPSEIESDQEPSSKSSDGVYFKANQTQLSYVLRHFRFDLLWHMIRASSSPQAFLKWFSMAAKDIPGCCFELCFDPNFLAEKGF